ncbi:protein MEMO1 [Dimargaris cristalligena]|uniref:Protein MEMO1 n=1 Tax=Dimargaris cristalligena TaxID=215637 RepID=A0A4V1J4K5_9FUNG|nr:protein MEMO1 [Dimargaris cristalligena]|eukprot:RKP35879.1 protein MEMO1 [Dimargaris cristalligena]
MCRQASHAGSWYSNDRATLDRQLSQWLDTVAQTAGPGEIPDHGVRAIISPHAGYAYSGQAAAYAFQCLGNNDIKRVFILGPSHHVYLKHCALSNCKEYETPLGNLILDTDVIADLKKTNVFGTMSRNVDEDEHSIEMQLPYLYKIHGKEKTVKVIPVLVGNLDQDSEQEYGQVFAKYLANKANFFIISSDFCHWGTRFRYTFYSPDDLPSSSPGLVEDYKDLHLPIYRSIENLDREGMKLLETLVSAKFYEYLEKTENTICGRHPIGILLQAIEQLPTTDEGDQVTKCQVQLKFVYYAQSSEVHSPRDSSVSYASAYVTIDS